MAEPRTPRHIVLVHGAWQGSWAFGAWQPLLEAAGWQVHAVDLPGNGWTANGAAPANLDSYTAHVAQVITAIDAPVVLLGHSGGGITASQVAEAVPDRVAALVYLAGMMLPSGVEYVDICRLVAQADPQAYTSGISPWLDWSADGLSTTVREEGALRCFLHDCEPGAARQAASLLRAQAESGRAMRNTLTAAAFGSVPRIYVECRDDQSVTLAIQRQMQAMSPGATCLSLDCGHVPQLAQPEQLTAQLLPLLAPLVDAALAAKAESASANSATSAASAPDAATC